MKMSIDESISWLVSIAEHAGDDDISIYDEDAIAIETAMNIMHKYQKIEKIVNNTFQNITKEDERYVYEWLGDIKEVIEDDSNGNR